MLGFFLNEKGINQNNSNNHNRNKVTIRLCITLTIFFFQVNLGWGTWLMLLWGFPWFLGALPLIIASHFLPALSYVQRKESKPHLSRMTSWLKDCKGGWQVCLPQTLYQYVCSHVSSVPPWLVSFGDRAFPALGHPQYCGFCSHKLVHKMLCINKEQRGWTNWP